MDKISVAKFGKDHWSLLAYVEHTCVNGTGGQGELDRSKMRCNSKRHPELAGNFSSLLSDGGWKLSYSTRLAGYFDFAERSDPEKAILSQVQVRDHEDWDCLEDLGAAGYVDVLSRINGRMQMTDAGLAVSAELRAFKAKGGQFAGFQLQAAVL